nr:linoleate 13S-lipoxygenase 3-1, chloroplastic [Tanacetum cinerariifolium]
MALAKELMGTSVLQEKQPSFHNSLKKPMHHHNHVSISENESFRIRTKKLVMVQEDFKETLVKKIDAFADQLIGRNVVLELFSLDVDPNVYANCLSEGLLIFLLCLLTIFIIELELTTCIQAHDDIFVDGSHTSVRQRYSRHSSSCIDESAPSVD